MSSSFIYVIKYKFCWRLKPFVISYLKKCFTTGQLFMNVLEQHIYILFRGKVNNDI